MPSLNANILEADSFELSFGNRQILSSVYIKCETGQVVSLSGRNGSGKSCLLRMVFGTMNGQYKSVRINRKYMKTPYQSKNAINYLPQQGFALPYVTFSKMMKIFNVNNTNELLEITEVKKNLYTPMNQLSSGTAKFLETLIILYSPTLFSLLDEPFTHLSPILVESLMPHIRKQSKHKGIILTDHLTDYVFSIATSSYYLHHGQIYIIKSAEDIEEFRYK